MLITLGDSGYSAQEKDPIRTFPTVFLFLCNPKSNNNVLKFSQEMTRFVNVSDKEAEKFKADAAESHKSHNRAN